jgi:hypothetical protein
VQGERPTEGKILVDEQGNAGAARRDIGFDALVHGVVEELVQLEVHDRALR